jgi:hypothetical protein
MRLPSSSIFMPLAAGVWSPLAGSTAARSMKIDADPSALNRPIVPRRM